MAYGTNRLAVTHRGIIEVRGGRDIHDIVGFTLIRRILQSNGWR